jgi:hypothetical protein
MSSRQRVDILKNLKYKLYFHFNYTFLVTTWSHMCYFAVLMSSLLFYNVENSKRKKHIWISRCVHTFDWYCKLAWKSIAKLENACLAIINNHLDRAWRILKISVNTYSTSQKKLLQMYNLFKNSIRKQPTVYTDTVCAI